MMAALRVDLGWVENPVTVFAVCGPNFNKLSHHTWEGL